MAKIAFILLCHKDPKAIIQQARQLTEAGDYIAIHFDASAPREAFAEIGAALGDNPNVAFASKRIRCGWGAWSLVQATLYALEAAVQSFPRATHFYMLSGDCMAIKSARHAHGFLDAHDFDFVESFDFFDSDWIKTGIKEERLIYRHFFNERQRKWLFYKSLELQKRFGLKRKIPNDIKVMIGSQWWCLRRQTIEAILNFTRERPDVMRFFRTTWIPDETFFQTLVPHLIPREQIRRRTLTFLMFSDYGMPVTFYNDHYDMLLGQDSLFARKISPEAKLLRSRLGQLYNSGREDFPISNEGRRLFHFLTGRGRTGHRFAERFWQNEATLGRDRELLIITCKKWHVAKRLANAIERSVEMPCYEFIFDEQGSPLPDLGGIENSMEKRTRHRRALARMLFEHETSGRMLFCIDPARLELIEDFYADRSQTRILEIVCDISDDYLAGHAQRVGLAGENTPEAALQQLVPTIRQDIARESDRIRDKEFEGLSRLRQGDDPELQKQAIAQFLRCTDDVATEVLNTRFLFDD